MIQNYFDELKQIIDSYATLPSVIETRVSFELRPSDQGYVVGAVLFQDQSVLHFREYVDNDGGYVSKQMYTYHYQDADQRLIFRYDNARHRPTLPTLEHKHTGDHATVSHMPTLEAVLAEIALIRGWA